MSPEHAVLPIQFRLASADLNWPSSWLDCLPENLSSCVSRPALVPRARGGRQARRVRSGCKDQRDVVCSMQSMGNAVSGCCVTGAAPRQLLTVLFAQRTFNERAYEPNISYWYCQFHDAIWTPRHHYLEEASFDVPFLETGYVSHFHDMREPWDVSDISTPQISLPIQIRGSEKESPVSKLVRQVRNITLQMA